MAEKFRPHVDSSAWYSLDLDGATLKIDVHKGIAPSAKSFDPEGASYYQRLLKIPHDFVMPNSDKKWGFGGVISEVGDDSDWVKFECSLPESGVSRSLNWDELYKVAASLSLLFNYLKEFKKAGIDTKAKIPQMAIVKTELRERGEMYGAMIWADVEPALGRFIGRNVGQRENAQIVEEATRSAYTRMWGEPYYNEEFGFRVSFKEPNLVHLDCPGNACGLDPSLGSKHSIDERYTLLPHNTDSAWQQLTLLSGVAKLSGLAMAEYK